MKEKIFQLKGINHSSLTNLVLTSVELPEMLLARNLLLPQACVSRQYGSEGRADKMLSAVPGTWLPCQAMPVALLVSWWTSGFSSSLTNVLRWSRKKRF